MPWLKVYEWERQKWPEFRVIRLSQDSAEHALKLFAKRFGVAVPSLVGGARCGGGSYQPGKRLVCRDLDEVLLVTLPCEDGDVTEQDGGLLYVNPGTIKVDFKRLTLAVLCHELAHHLNHSWHAAQARRRKHGKTFRKCLSRVYSWARGYLPGKEETTICLPHWCRELEEINRQLPGLEVRQSERGIGKQILGLQERKNELLETISAFREALARGALSNRPLHSARRTRGTESNGNGSSGIKREKLLPSHRRGSGST